MSLNEYVILILSLAGMAWLAFDRTAKVASDEFKAIVKQVFNYEIASNHWPNQANKFFVDVFGKKHWSMHCLKRSILVSVIWTLLILLFLFIVDIKYNTKELSLVSSSGLKEVAYFSALVFTWNIIPDYFSLYETRYIISRLQNANLRNSVTFIFIDIALTYLIFLLFSTIGVFITGVVMNNFYGAHVGSYFNAPLEYLLLGGTIGMIIEHIPIQGVKFVDLVVYAVTISTFITSVWIWFYLLAIGYTKFTNKYVAPVWTTTKRFVDIENKPIESLGYISGLVIILIGILLSPVVLIK